jgi:hypothetical protein
MQQSEESSASACLVFSVTQPVYFWGLPVKSEQKDITTEITEGTEKKYGETASRQLPNLFAFLSFLLCVLCDLCGSIPLPRH